MGRKVFPLTHDEINARERLPSKIKEEVQDYYVRAYLARAKRKDFDEKLKSEEKIVDEQFSNGPCVYCGKDDGFTEIRKCGPVHLTRCWVAYNSVQKRKINAK